MPKCLNHKLGIYTQISTTQSPGRKTTTIASICRYTPQEQTNRRKRKKRLYSLLSYPFHNPHFILTTTTIPTKPTTTPSPSTTGERRQIIVSTTTTTILTLKQRIRRRSLLRRLLLLLLRGGRRRSPPETNRLQFAPLTSPHTQEGHQGCTGTL